MPQGQPLTVPADGLTTKARRNAPVLAVHTGPGKGKSTAAFGMALRAWNQGFDVAVFQFVKSAKWKVGEESAFRELGRMHDEHGIGGSVEWHKMGSGWSWTRKPGSDVDHAAAAADGWAEISRRLSEQRHDFYVLDEFTYPLKWGWVDTVEVVEALVARPGRQHVVITGRDAPPGLIDAADLVTEMTKVKHPMDAGRKGQRGIEW
ncbi:cob(I)yrinic acid a,c-diamide adenosyltransferase [Mycolicibacterium hodleri]|uniref:Cob(I)yrinic acid a,c-diamide adenosyltransferase n=1 Tax=Mycolicibacterium hodleri TaxID=49897 RepID=A0A502EK97_9MYCO|nr:cob(I)yrinic acid a,c-diamide adenosyltransferase [Mycolicibacterium hodleri]TPG37402.1 cob(I)yrinic acid a,c-diamide adenosyltransferase [Mycolicibacterium hodleri]